MIMKNSIADELSNKIYHLHKALEQAKHIIKTLEEENHNLKDIVLLLEKKESPLVIL